MASPRRESTGIFHKVHLVLMTGVKDSIRSWDVDSCRSVFLWSDPTLWSEWEVNHWLDWCQAEFGLHCLGSDLKGLQGSELCSLDRETFLGLMSDCTAGEILWEHLEIMRRGRKTEKDTTSVMKDTCE